MSDEENIFQRYMDDVAKYELLSVEKEKELFKDMYKLTKSKGKVDFTIKSKALRARERLIEGNLRLVIKIAKEFRNIGLDYEDLINEGNIGLTQAVDKFDLDKGAKLSYYASFWIKQAIRRAISNKGRTIRLPVAVVDLKLKVHKYIENYESKHFCTPSAERIAKELKVPISKINKILKINLQSDSLNATVSEEVELIDILENQDSPEPLSVLLKKRDRHLLASFLNRLDRRQRYIIIRRFGLDGAKPQTLEAIGQTFDLTRERIRQLELVALQSLKEMYKSSGEK